MSQFRLTPAQRRQLRGLLQATSDLNTYRRCLALLEVDARRAIADGARSLGITRQSGHNWSARFGAADAADNRADRYGGGRPATLGAEDVAGLVARLGPSPQHCGRPAAHWTVPRLREHRRHATGADLSEPPVRRPLRRLGDVGKRPRYVRDPDPEHAKKTPDRPQAAERADTTAVLAEDETDLLRLPPRRGGGGRRGEPLPVPISGRNARRVIVGALSLKTGPRRLLPRARPRAGDFQAVRRPVRRPSRRGPVAMVLDEDPSPRAQGSVGRAEEVEIELLWLPKRAPERNPIAGLGGDGTDVVCADHQYESIDKEEERLVASRSGLSNRDALEKAGVFSEDFWLKRAVSKTL